MTNVECRMTKPGEAHPASGIRHSLLSLGLKARCGAGLLCVLFAAGLQAQELVAHRGVSARAPENTLAAFNLAWSENADACELDLHLSADGRIVILHDKDTLRTTGVQHLAAETPAATLTALDAGSWKDPKWKGERIPTLEQALATLPEGRQRFLLEVKCGPEVVPHLRQALEPWRVGRAHQIAIISFNKEVCAAAKKALPWVKVLLLSSWKKKGDDKPNDLADLIARARADGLDGLNLGRDWPWSPEFIQTIRDAGLGVFVWTVNNPEEARKLAALGVDGITTDDPAALRRALDGAGPSS